MALHTDTRYRFVFEEEAADGQHYLTECEPFAYEDLPDNTLREVHDGDTWHSIAGEVFKALARTPESRLFSERLKPSGLFWILMDFQPEPYLDPTVPPPPGNIVIPSVRTVIEKLRSPDRRRYS